MEEGGWPWVTMVTPLQVVEKSTSCVCTCACVCVTIDTHTFGVDSQLLVWNIGTIISHSCYMCIMLSMSLCSCMCVYMYVCVCRCMCVWKG